MPVLQHHDAVREEQRALQVVRHDDGSDAAFLVKLANETVDRGRRHGIEAGSRLVVQHYVALAHQDPREARPLLHAARDLGRIAVRRVRKLHRRERVRNAPVYLVVRKAGALPEGQRDILANREPAQQRAALEQVADASAHRLERLATRKGNLRILQPHVSLRWREKPHQVLERDGLAGARRSYERQDLALRDGEGHSGKDFPAVELLHNVIEPYHGDENYSIFQ